uniref:Uncharacterized protein n=1 Tax=Lactuca sativa TaxID=4236 RepID=A0A9R1XT89_LACSA|nr:hypothetical protein LSAT_V11C100041240 [Lactuca sativa]
MKREDKVYITVLLADTEDAKVNLAPEGVFTLSASAGQHEYDLKLELFDKVNVEAWRVAKVLRPLYDLQLFSLKKTTMMGLIGLLVKLASGSMVVVKTLFDLNISSILKEILSIYDLSHGVPSPRTIDGHYNQMHEVLKLLIQFLPVVSRNQEVPLAAEKEVFLVTHPGLVEKFGNDLLHVLIQVGCLSVVDKLLYYSNSDMLLDLLKSTNISRGHNLEFLILNYTFFYQISLQF